MTTDLDSLRRGLGKLYIKRTVGDVTEKVFQHEIADKTVDLYRAVIARKLAEGEDLIAEHHTITSHFRMTQSVLREPEQHAISLFMTDRRLLRLRSTVFPGRPPTADARDGTVIDELGFDRITGLKYRRQYRLGESGVGAAMCCIAVLFYEFLALTAPVLIVLGTLGIIHSILLPTRWVEIRTADYSGSSDPFIMYTVKKRSARRLIGLLRERAIKR
jgi:hypothetical protein